MTTWIALCLAPVFLAQMGPQADEILAPEMTAPQQASASAAHVSPTSAHIQGDKQAQQPERRPLLLGTAPKLSLCAEAFHWQNYRRARDCYRRRQDLTKSHRDKKIAAQMALLADAMALQKEQKNKLKQSVNKKPSAAVRFVTEGGAELSLLSAAYGFYLGILADMLVSQLSVVMNSNAYYGSSASFAMWSSLMFLTPIITGLGAGTGAVLASLKLDAMTAGDANLIRSSLLLIPVDQLAIFYFVLQQMSSHYYGYDSNLLGLQSSLAFFASGLLLPGLSILAASLVDLPDGAVSLANSAAIWGAVLTALSMGAIPEFYAATDPNQLLALVGVANLAWFGTLIASPWIPKVERHETWALDLGALLGLGAGAALAYGLHAPSPLIGWGTMAMGLVAGGAAGFAAARYAPAALKKLELPKFPKIIALTPTLIPAAKVEQTPALAMGLVLAL